jgi:DNA polymerase IV
VNIQNRRIIHLDLDAFFCAVEEQRDPSLVGKPFAVGGRPDERGVVASCSYAARQFGIRSAMPMARALKLCPELIIVGSRHRDYSEVSRQVMQRLRELTPLVEQISIDEAFLDVSELEESPEAIARRLQAGIRDELGLPCSLGLASNKLVAKIATDVGKIRARGTGPPSALTSVQPGKEAEFLAPLPVEMLWGVGPKTAERLDELGIHTIGELAAWPQNDLINRFGKHGFEMFQHARGLDERPIETSHEVKSISQEITFARDVRNEAELRRTLQRMAEQVARRLQKQHLQATTIKLKIRWPDFTTLTRQLSLSQPTDQAQEIAAGAERLFGKVWQKGKPVRLIGVGVSGLDARPRQLGLFDVENIRQQRLREAISELKDKYGNGVVKRGFEED